MIGRACQPPEKRPRQADQDLRAVIPRRAHPQRVLAVKRKCEQVSQHRTIRTRHEQKGVNIAPDSHNTSRAGSVVTSLSNVSTKRPVQAKIIKRSGGHLTNPGPRIRAKFKHLFPEQIVQDDNRPMSNDTVAPSSTGLVINQIIIASSASSSSTGPYIPTRNDVSPLPKQAVKRKFDTKPSFSAASRHSALRKAARTSSVGEKPHPAPHLTEE